jgi:hypothetical protein
MGVDGFAAILVKGDGGMPPRSRAWADFAEALRRQSLMDDMLVVQHVDIIAAVREGEAFVRARANCRACACEGACRDWFLEGADRPADFCPNLDFFASLPRGEDQG